MSQMPMMKTVRQRFPRPKPVDFPQVIAREMERLAGRFQPGASIAVAVGSRGISNLQTIVRQVINWLKKAGAQPYLVPAMGSHGGAVSSGQIQLLGEYGVTESSLNVPIDASMETRVLGRLEQGVEVHFSEAAMRADSIFVINRIKPHTDFRGALGSGLLKMMVVGLGKRNGASNFHRAAHRYGFELVLRSASRKILQNAPILGGLALVENQFHDTSIIQSVPPEDMESTEESLLKDAARLMARLPSTQVDLLIVDRMGKNISGSGLDPNVIGRSVHGYSSLLKDRDQDTPAVRRLMVRSLTPESHGNATGLGMADFTTRRLLQSMDAKISTINVLTAMTLQGVKIPIHFETDRETIEQAMATLGLAEGQKPRVMQIADTLNLEVVRMSEAYAEEIEACEGLETLADWSEMSFDGNGYLQDIPLTP